MNGAREFLINNIKRDGLTYFGVGDDSEVNEIAAIWDDDKHKHWRWDEVEHYQDHQGKILDMAAGVGTFVLQGLRSGYDVYGLEPESWKIAYFNMKIKEGHYPRWYLGRIIKGVGESLPFQNESFDYITTYQTLEHVANVEKCLEEMIRVLKPGGKLKIMAPDYNLSWYEPHYSIPFYPAMNRKMAKTYLRLRARPIEGLLTLKWVSASMLKSFFLKYSGLEVTDLAEVYSKRSISKISIDYCLPHSLAGFIFRLTQLPFLFVREKQINIIVRKEIR